MSAETLDDREPSSDAIEARMGSHVEGIMAAARKAAAQFQAEVERAANERGAQIETAAARRAHAVRMGAEEEAERLVMQARSATQQYVTASRRLVDEFARERMNRIAEVGDKLAAHADALIEPLMRSDELARQLHELRNALGVASERIASEARNESPRLPDLVAPALAGDPSPPQGGAEGDWPAVPASLEERLKRATARPRKRVSGGDDQPPAGAGPAPAAADTGVEENADAT